MIWGFHSNWDGLRLKEASVLCVRYMSLVIFSSCRFLVFFISCLFLIFSIPCSFLVFSLLYTAAYNKYRSHRQPSTRRSCSVRVRRQRWRSVDWTKAKLRLQPLRHVSTSPYLTRNSQLTSMGGSRQFLQPERRHSSFSWQRTSSGGVLSHQL